MTTYTIASAAGLLLATVPDGEDIAAAVAAEAARAGIEVAGYETEGGLILTDERPDRAAWRGSEMGCLFDAQGQSYSYAVRA